MARSIPAPAGGIKNRSVDGLSPRLRGNRWRQKRGIRCAGSIPAPAGEPSAVAIRPGEPSGGRSIPAPAGEPHRPPAPCCPPQVYPRACGGTPVRRQERRVAVGLSPRLRGNPRQIEHRDRGGGSIPAPAGEPSLVFLILAVSSVYPRACGGTGKLLPNLLYGYGLSPRLRGNPSDVLTLSYQYRSIPAPAGEPSRFLRRVTLSSVYPRACGGTRV